MWRNEYARAVPCDPSEEPGTRQVQGAAYSRVRPTPCAAPRLLAASARCAALLGVRDARGELLGRPEAAEWLSGNMVLEGSETYAHCYGGHQFGTWAGQLGDGRAISLGQLEAPGLAGEGEGGGGEGVAPLLELQLKGAGKTPYSRRADGRAVLRSSLREFVGSEAMHALGVPTTRALSLAATGQGVLRDQFYDGNATLEPGAVVCRLAPSFVRFGSLELPAVRKDEHLMRAILDNTINAHFELPEGAERYGAFLDEVVASTGALAARWQSVGFVHGVLNTDNCSVHGLTIDYGPFAFLEAFDPNFTPNSSDSTRRYAFGAQANIMAENCARLAMALEPLLGPDLQANIARASEGFAASFYDAWQGELRRKLGLAEFDEERDDALSVGLFTLMARARADHTNTWRLLADVDSSMSPAEALEAIRPAFGAHGLEPVALESDGDDESQDPAALLEDAGRLWMAQYLERLREDAMPDGERVAMMHAASPKYVPRNHLMQAAITAAENDDTGPLERLMEVMLQPYDEQPDAEAQGFASPTPREQLRPGVVMLS